jgi:hypothetical protein
MVFLQKGHSSDAHGEHETGEMKMNCAAGFAICDFETGTGRDTNDTNTECALGVLLYRGTERPVCAHG